MYVYVYNAKPGKSECADRIEQNGLRLRLRRGI